MQTAKNYNVLRVSQNLKALGALKSNQPKAEILKTYTGWGGLREAIYTPEVYRELKKLLTANEIASLKQNRGHPHLHIEATPSFLIVQRLGILISGLGD